MQRGVLLTLIVVAVVAVAALAMRGDSDPEGVSLEELSRRAAQRKAEDLTARSKQKDLDYLATQGKGLELPDRMVSGIDAVENVWFVGDANDQSVGVEIPFKPGQLPRPPSDAQPVHENPGFLGAESCKSCHEDKYDSFIHTAHHLTSRPATQDLIAGSFEDGNNVMRTHNDRVSFEMRWRDDQAYQRVNFFDWQFEVPFHLIFGSSKLAEAYLYWHDDQLYQMHCNYLTSTDSWINSPGFKDGDAIYCRPVVVSCVDCHVTYVDFTKQKNHYVPSSMILGVSCERCHGPGQKHVEYHQANPDAIESRYLSVPSDLPREQELDVCAQCHNSEKLLIDGKQFQFRPGDNLYDYYVDLPDEERSTNTVHTSNQIARLKMSQCFQQSEMACVECHNPHQNERGNALLFSQRCMECHQADACGMHPKLGEQLTQNCVDCHMPKRATSELHMETAEGKIFPPLRDHFIRVDEDATEDYLRLMKLEDN